MYSLFARIRQLVLPNSALPNDAAIILGPDLPACMQTNYVAAIFFRPTNTASGGVNALPLGFIAQRKITATQTSIDEGWAVWDGSTVCGYVVTGRRFAENTGAGALFLGYNYETEAPHGAVSLAFGGTGASFQFGAADVGRPPNPISFGAFGKPPSGAPLTIDGTSIARGIRATVSSTANTAAIGAEAVVLTTPAMTWYNNRAYEVLFGAAIIGSVANNEAFLLVRRTNLAGALKFSANYRMSASVGNGINCAGRVIIVNNGADVTDNLVLTQQALGGGTTTGQGSASNVRYLEIRDCGATNDYINAVNI